MFIVGIPVVCRHGATQSVFFLLDKANITKHVLKQDFCLGKVTVTNKYFSAVGLNAHFQVDGASLLITWRLFVPGKWPGNKAMRKK